MLNKLNPYLIFKISFGICFIVGLHLTLEYTEGLGLYLPNNVILWMFVSLWIGLGFWNIYQTGSIKFSQFNLVLWIGFVFLCIPFIYQTTYVFELAYLRFLGIIGILFLYFSLQQINFEKPDENWFYYIIICSILLKSSFELFHYFFSDLLLNTNFDNYFFNTLNQRNIQSTFLILGPILSLYLIMGKNKNNNIYPFKELILFSTTFIASIMLMLLQSRTAMIAFPISIILIFLGKYNYSKNLIIWILLTFFGLWIGNYLKENPSLNSKLTFQKRTIESKQKSTKARLDMYSISYKIWKQNPFGTGYGTFLSSFRNYYAEEYEKNTKLTDFGSSNVLHPHNEILFWSVEGGIVPFIGLIIIIGSFIIMIWKTKSRKIFILLGCIFPIIFHTQLEYPFYNSTIHFILFCFFIYQIDQKYGIHFKIKNSFNFLPKLFAIIIPIISIFYLGTVLQTGYMITKYEKTGYKNLKFLQKALNPYSLKKKYDNLVLKNYLNIAKKTQNKEKLQNYISIVEQNLKHSPFLFLYYDLTTAYKALGNMDKAKEIYNRGKYLYPGTD